MTDTISVNVSRIPPIFGYEFTRATCDGSSRCLLFLRDRLSGDTTHVMFDLETASPTCDFYPQGINAASASALWAALWKERGPEISSAIQQAYNAMVAIDLGSQHDEIKQIASEPRCENCRYSFESIVRECRRFPPAAHQSSIPVANSLRVFPIMAMGDFCGEFQPKDKP